MGQSEQVYQCKGGCDRMNVSLSEDQSMWSYMESVTASVGVHLRIFVN